MALFLAGLILASGLPAVPAPALSAQDRHKGEWRLPPHYPDGFHGWGRIDRISSKEVVIDDCLLKLSPSISYHTPTQTDGSRSWIGPGRTVGYMLNERREVLSLWLIREGGSGR